MLSGFPHLPRCGGLERDHLEPPARFSMPGHGPLLPALRISVLCPISPELLEIGPEVRDVLVVLDADKCHAGARHFLHRRADIFGERFLAPRDTGRFIGWGVVETAEGGTLA